MQPQTNLKVNKKVNNVNIYFKGKCVGISRSKTTKNGAKQKQLPCQHWLRSYLIDFLESMIASRLPLTFASIIAESKNYDFQQSRQC